ncbi:hypothetical protein D3C78_1618170 [compost metagenome]
MAGVVLGSLGGAGKAPKTKYQPNQGSVANMGDYLKQPGFGSELAGAVRKTNQKYQGQTIFQATKDNGSTIKKGDQLYLDGAHKNHLEVFDKKGYSKAVLNLDGSINQSKTDAAKGRRLR